MYVFFFVYIFLFIACFVNSSLEVTLWITLMQCSGNSEGTKDKKYQHWYKLWSFGLWQHVV
jgi:hypothetical protein